MPIKIKNKYPRVHGGDVSLCSGANKSSKDSYSVQADFLRRAV